MVKGVCICSLWLKAFVFRMPFNAPHYAFRRFLSPNTVELAVRYVRNRASNYSPLTKGGYRGVRGRGDPAGLGRKITPPTPPSQGGDEFAISTATVGYN